MFKRTANLPSLKPDAKERKSREKGLPECSKWLLDWSRIHLGSYRLMLSLILKEWQQDNQDRQYSI